MLNECEIKQLLTESERKMWATKDNCEYCREQIKVQLLQAILGYHEGKPVRVGEDVNPQAWFRKSSTESGRKLK